MDVIFFQHIDQLRESRCDVYTLLILDSLDPLFQDFFRNHGQIIPQLSFRHFIQIHENRDKRCLAIGGHQCNDLILDQLNALLHFFFQAQLRDPVDGLLICFNAAFCQIFPGFLAEFFTADIDKRHQMRQRNALAAILGAGNLSHCLCRDIACRGKAVGLLDQGSADNRAVLEHVLQVHQAAVVHMLGKVIRVMEVDDAFFMGFPDIFRQQETLGDILADLSCHIVSLHAIDRRVFVGIFLFDFFVVILQKSQDLLIGGVGFSHQRPFVTIGDVIAGHGKGPLIHDLIFHQILDLFHAQCTVHSLTDGTHICGNHRNLLLAHLFALRYRAVRFLYSCRDFVKIKGIFCSASFDDLHVRSPLHILSSTVFSLPGICHCIVEQL